MAKRTTARRLAMQAIFQHEISNTDIDEALMNLFDEEKCDEGTMAFSRKLAEGTIKNRESLDGELVKLSKNWTLDRIDLVSKSILRLALYELKFEKDTPKPVIINEAINLAKRYVDESAAKFINGILDAAVL